MSGQFDSLLASGLACVWLACVWLACVWPVSGIYGEMVRKSDNSCAGTNAGPGEKIRALPSVRQTMAACGFYPKKSLGQHFLLDPGITAKIVYQAGDLRGKKVLEIGPGPGGLTRAILLSGVEKLCVVEKDTRAIALIRDLAEISRGQLEILEQDALLLELETLENGPDHIIANLPYNIATALLARWLKFIHRCHIARSDALGNVSVSSARTEKINEIGKINALSSLILMFQKEVGERLVARPGSKAFGRLSILTQWLCHVSVCFELAPEVFTPAPKVRSIVIKLEPRNSLLFEASFQEVENMALLVFRQRRKMLRHIFRIFGDQGAELLARAEIDGTRRAETLSVQEFGKLLAVHRRHKEG